MPALAFAITYFMLGGAVVLATLAFFVATSIRNRTDEIIAQLANIPANALATFAAHIRAFGTSLEEAVPDTAFGEGAVKRFYFAVTAIILVVADAILADARLTALLGLEPHDPPFNVSWTAALSWVLSGALFAAVSLDLRHEVVGHPFDSLDQRWHRPLRILSDVCFCVVVVSGVVFYALGALLTAGSAPIVLNVLFQSLLGFSLIVASAIAGWAGLFSISTLFGVVLIILSRIVRAVAIIPEQLVIIIRRSAYLAMALVDLPLIGLIRPVMAWWASSKFGKAIGFPPLEEPIAWPPVGFVEAPAEKPIPEERGESNAPVPFPVASADADEIALDDEEAA